MYVSYIVPSTEPRFFLGGRERGGGLLQILSLKRGTNSQRGAHLKLGANSSICSMSTGQSNTFHTMAQSPLAQSPLRRCNATGDYYLAREQAPQRERANSKSEKKKNCRAKQAQRGLGRERVQHNALLASLAYLSFRKFHWRACSQANYYPVHVTGNFGEWLTFFSVCCIFCDVLR